MAVLPAIAIASAVIAAAGTAAAAKAQSDAQRYNAEVGKNNANYAEQAAAENARRQQVAATQQIGQLRANIGASGLQTEGSPLDLLEQSARNSELDRLTILHQGAVQANALRNGATLDSLGSTNSLIAGGLSASGQLLGGAANAYATWPSGSGPSLGSTSGNAAIGSAYSSTAARDLAYGGGYSNLKLVG